REAPEPGRAARHRPRPARARPPVGARLPLPRAGWRGDLDARGRRRPRARVVRRLPGHPRRPEPPPRLRRRARDRGDHERHARRPASSARRADRADAPSDAHAFRRCLLVRGGSGPSRARLLRPPGTPAAARTGDHMTRSTRTAFVTGATGLLGSNLVRELLRRGFAVRALARDAERAGRLLPDAPGVRIVPGDMEDVPAFAPPFAGSHAVFHAAPSFP